MINSSPPLHGQCSKANTTSTKAMLGCLAVFASAFCFYFATAVIRWAAASQVLLDPAFFVFTRFMLGFLVMCMILICRKQPLIPRRYDLLFGRTIANCVAVYCFYKGVSLTSVAEANILNMTYPVFVMIFSWIFLKNQRDLKAAAIVPLTFAGIWLIVSPGQMEPDVNHLWGVASGISAAFAILYLNLSRQFHDSETILFYMFGPGALLIFLLFHNKIFIPDTQGCYYLLLSAVSGILGQYLITIGFRYVTAVEGGIISSTRILLAALLGPWIASDMPLSVGGWIGAIIIFSTNIYVTLRKAR